MIMVRSPSSQRLWSTQTLFSRAQLSRLTCVHCDKTLIISNSIDQLTTKLPNYHNRQAGVGEWVFPSGRHGTDLHKTSSYFLTLHINSKSSWYWRHTHRRPPGDHPIDAVATQYYGVFLSSDYVPYCAVLQYKHQRSGARLKNSVIRTTSGHIFPLLASSFLGGFSGKTSLLLSFLNQNHNQTSKYTSSETPQRRWKKF